MQLTGSHIAKGLVILSGALVLLLGLLIMVQEATMIANWSRSGFVLCAVRQLPDTTLVFHVVDPADFTAAPYPMPDDTILTLGDSTATLQSWIDRLERPHTPGREVGVTYLRAGVEQANVFRTRPVFPQMKLGVMVLQALKMLIFLSFVTIAFWAFLRRAGSAGVRTLALFCFAMATFMTSTPMPMFREMASFTIPLVGVVRTTLGIIGGFFGGHWLLLQFLFPRRRRIVLERPWRAYALAYGPMFLLMTVGGVLALLKIKDFPPLRFAGFSVLVAQVIAGSILLWRHHRRTESMLERRQTKLVLYGAVPGLLLFIVYLVFPIGLIGGKGTPPWLPWLVMTNILFIVLLLVPITFAYAFGKYRLLEVEGRLRRGTRYLMVTGALLALFFGVVYIVGDLLLHNLNITSRAPTLLVALVLALGFTPAHRMIQTQLERYFYPERLRLRAMVRDFLKNAFALPDRQALCADLETRLRQCLGVKTVHLWQRDAALESERDLFLADGAFMTFLKREGHPLFVDEAFASDRVCCPLPEQQWLDEKDVALVLPLTTHDGLQGFLALGHKPGREDYQAEELQILTTLAEQVALAVENQRLLQENIEKRRMEEELHVARRVQERFLPKDVPTVPGLDLAAHSTFCLEIAGDYYDIISLPDGRTVLAVGDVAGKGAGAALIMANLQAGLRALAGLNLDLPDVMARLNTLLYQNTDADQFVTLVVAIYDPRERTLRYVNAGHNPPLVIRGADGMQPLCTGGLLLGAFPAAVYASEERRLERGDVLLFYTDGISEAMDEAGVELGEERLGQAVRAVGAAPAREVLNTITALALSHQGEGHVLEDDQTLLIARIL